MQNRAENMVTKIPVTSETADPDVRQIWEVQIPEDQAVKLRQYVQHRQKGIQHQETMEEAKPDLRITVVAAAQKEAADLQDNP